MRKLRKIAVFCGSSSGSSSEYAAGARRLGEEMVRRGIGLVYGGGSVGLMGVIAETVARGLGEENVIGVIPRALCPREISGTTHGEHRVVEDMHSRKAMMFAEADGFITIAGGFGTMDETLEITTWQQLGYHSKPVGLLNTAGFYDLLLAFFDHATAAGFIRPESRGIVLSSDDPAELIDKMLAYEAPLSVIELATNGQLPPNQRG